MESCASISSAIPPSLILRPKVFTFERNIVRASCCVSVLPPSTRAAAADVAHDRAAETDRIDAGMVVEAAILDRDDRVLQIGGDLVERDVVPLFVEPEPRLAVGAVEHGVADAARQAVHGDGVARQPDAGDGGAADQRDQQRRARSSRSSAAAAAGSVRLSFVGAAVRSALRSSISA